MLWIFQVFECVEYWNEFYYMGICDIIIYYIIDRNVIKFISELSDQIDFVIR
jgi:hypothetical protein